MIEREDRRDIFRYNLSAFLAAFRSVTMIMHEEFDKAPGFVDWYRVQQDGMRLDDKMQLLNTKRTMTIHKKPVQPYAHVSMSVTEQDITVTENASMIMIRGDGPVERYDLAPVKKPSRPMLYTQLINFESDEYSSAVAKSLEEARKLVEAGFEYVTDIDECKLFRKRK